MSFQESIIVPLSVFRKCKFEAENEKEKEILTTHLPPDVKMKLFKQQQHFKIDEKKPEKEKKEIPPPNIDTIVSSVSINYRPYAKSILEKIISNEEINWNDRYEIIINGQVYPESNIVEIIQFLLKSKVVTSDEDIPKATTETYNKLLEIGVPQSWIKVRFVKRNKRRRSRIPTQSGKGLVWEKFSKY